MSRFSRYDTDEERLPEGMTRVGYDADSQVYTFQDADGSYWESAPGCQYGQLYKVGEAREGTEDTEPFLGSDRPKTSWRNDMMPLLNFGLLVGLFLLSLMWYLHWAATPSEVAAPDCIEGETSYAIQGGDTCWDVADGHGLSVEDILASNAGLDCAKLRVGAYICLPTAD